MASSVLKHFAAVFEHQELLPIGRHAVLVSPATRDMAFTVSGARLSFIQNMSKVMPAAERHQARQQSGFAVLVVHGVGPFDDRFATEKDVRCQLERWGIVVSRLESFDWASIVGYHSDSVPAVTRAIFRLLFLTSADGNRWTDMLHTLATLATQASLFLLPVALMLSVPSVERFANWVVDMIVALLERNLSDAVHLLWTLIPGLFRAVAFRNWVFFSGVTVVVVIVAARINSGRYLTIRLIRQLTLAYGWPLISVTVLLNYARVPWVLMTVSAPFFLFAVGMALGGIGNAIFNTGTHKEFFWASLWFLSAAAFILCVAAGLYYSSKPFLAIFKRYADTILWLGDPAYRMNLRRQLSRTLREVCCGHKRILLVGHSLGTVLLTDYLMASVVSRRRLQRYQIRLVTFGSPLKSLISKFYPEFFPPPSAQFKQLGRVHPDFAWMNAYRPKDYIGRELGLPAEPRACDVCTEQWEMPRLASHSNYWSESRAWNPVCKSLMAVNGVNGRQQAAEASEEVPAWPVDFGPSAFSPHLPYLERFREVVGFVIRISVFGFIPLVALFAVVFQPVQRYRRMQSAGVEAVAHADCSANWTQHQAGLPGSSGPYSSASCIITFLEGGTAQVQTVPVEGVDVDLPSSSLQLGLRPVLVGDAVKIKYQRDNPKEIVILEGRVHNGDREFKILAAPSEWIWARVFGVCITSIVLTILLFKPLLSIAVSLEGLFGLDSGQDSLSALE
jgi:Lipase (class 3)